MNQLQLFNFNDNQIRIIQDDKGEPWFVAKDVCDALNIQNGRDAIGRIDADGVGTTDIIDSLGRTQRMSIVNEPGLYELTFMSRKTEAKTFKRWITHEVLPAIRKHGAYLTPKTVEEFLTNPDTIIQLATNLKSEQIKRRIAEQQLQDMIVAKQQVQIELMEAAPKAQYHDLVLNSRSYYLTDQIAKELGMTAVTLNKKLRGKGVIMKRNDQWVLTADYLNNGFTDTKTFHYAHKDGTPATRMNTVWTEKGRKLIHLIFNSRLGEKDFRKALRDLEAI